jgi:hypothetical protein
MSLGTFLKLRLTHVLLIAFHRKASPSPSNAWLSKIRVDLVSVCGSVVVVLHRPALIMGPPNLFMIFDLSGSALGAVKQFFASYIYI